MQVFSKKIQKNLVMSKKSSTFASAFDQMVEFANNQINGKW